MNKSEVIRAIRRIAKDRTGRARFCEPWRRVTHVFALDAGFQHSTSNRAQWRFRSLHSPLCWRRYVLPLRWTLERDRDERWRAFCALAVEAREAAWNARQKRVGGMQRELSYLVFYARRRVSPGRSEGFLCPGCGLAVVLERHGDTVDKSGRRGTFELWHEAPQCEGFAVFSYSLTQVSEVEAGGDRTKLVQGGVMRIAKHEGLPS